MKIYRPLKGKKVFREVIKKGRRFYEREIQVIAYRATCNEDFYYKSSKDARVSCLVKPGIQIAKKYGNSVERNRAKRRVRAICSEVLRGAENKFCIIIRPLENFKNLNYEDSKKIITSLFKKAGVLRSV